MDVRHARERCLCYTSVAGSRHLTAASHRSAKYSNASFVLNVYFIEYTYSYVGYKTAKPFCYLVEILSPFLKLNRHDIYCIKVKEFFKNVMMILLFSRSHHRVLPGQLAPQQGSFRCLLQLYTRPFGQSGVELWSFSFTHLSDAFVNCGIRFRTFSSEIDVETSKYASSGLLQ